MDIPTLPGRALRGKRFGIGAAMRASLVAAAAALMAVAAGPVQADVRDASGIGADTERQLTYDGPVNTWLLDPAVFADDQGDLVTVEKVVEPELVTVKVADLVDPVHFDEGDAVIPDEYVDRLRQVLDSMRGRDNVRLHFVGHSDSLPLRPAFEAVYGDNFGLSRERAGVTAEYCQQTLDLPAEAISYEGLGETSPIADNSTAEGRALNRRVEVEVWYDEAGEKVVEREVVVPRQVNRVKVCRSETVCKMRYIEGHSHRAKVKNLLTPLRYEVGQVSVSESYLEQIAQTLQNLDGKGNVAVKFIAYTDDSALTGREQRIYGDQLGFSKAVARRVALSVQESLGLPDAAVMAEGRGPSRPVASNETPRGRMLNRRVEVEFWHDDPLQELPGEPQLCPDEAGAETVTRVYHPPSGPIAPINFDDGSPVIPEGYAERLAAIMGEIKDKANVRLRFIGYAGNRRLDRRTAAIYGDDIGWSASRARRAMEAVSGQLGLASSKTEFEGRGYVQSDDVVNAGFVATDESRVKVQVVYDELMALDTYEGVEIIPMQREVELQSPYALPPMRITVDGKPVNEPEKSSPDVQRCTDVALEKARVSFTADNLRLTPRLNITAWPRVIAGEDDPSTDFAENEVIFRLYTNYPTFIERAEVRVFLEEQSVNDTPLAVIELDGQGLARWSPEAGPVPAAGTRLKYLVRAYDAEARFDETIPQPLWLTPSISPETAAADPRAELLAGYGESRIASRNIPLHGGTVLVHGEQVPAAHTVWLAGYPVPVDGEGKFVSEVILPHGMHTVELAILDGEGNGELYLRDLEFDSSDWFAVGIADVTAGANFNGGDATELNSDDRYDKDIDVSGRLAFYTKGKFDNGWQLTASADTREGPFDELFTNFMDKSPEAQLRRLDSDERQPTYGDDSTVVDDAPTLGKFYVKTEKDEDYALWGNFKVAYTDTDLAHVDRTLYGANAHHQSEDTTSFGESRLMIDGFAADSGTVAARDEFRGTGGSLYYLRQRDILQLSERLRIEVRDKDSGVVLEVKNLSAGLDYDIDYMQGRILLAQPLSPTAGDDLLVQSEANGGNPAYLVARYEYTPGFDDIDTLSTGGRAQYWVNDYVKVGVTGNHDEAAGDESKLAGADVTLRGSAQSWLKLEYGRTDGAGVPETESIDGGFNFNTGELGGATSGVADAYRADASVEFSDFTSAADGRTTLYYQQLDAGYSAPGLITAKDTKQYGGTLEVPVTESVDVLVKADKLVQERGLETQAGELDADYRVDRHWTVSAGVRHEQRDDNSDVVPDTQREGERTDALAKVLYDSRDRWSAYTFGQGTVHATGNRDDNNRLGAGGSYQVTDRLSVNGELSGGDTGAAGKVGTEYLYSDRTTFYLNYVRENERTDDGVRARRGSMVTGSRSRYSDSVSAYVEERYTHGDVPTGLIHTTGVELTPGDRLNLGANADFGTLHDPRTGAETKRTAVGARAGYGFDKVKLASAVEYRVDDQEQPDTSMVKRTTWLFKNGVKYQLNPDWRLIGQFNYSQSRSSLGDFYDGDFTQAVLGSAYRPVSNDKLNALFKYMYYSNVPAVEQVTGDGAASNYLQRSQILSLDVNYDLTKLLTLGGKYAYRMGEVSQDRVDREFFRSDAHLYVLRADMHVVYRWDVLVEGRVLDLPDAGDTLSGALLGVYRHLGEHVKLGLGYNFSKFSDDLTDLDYDHQGLFINLIGKI